MTQPRFNAGRSGRIMYAMPYGDDLDARFNDLVAQFSQDERRRMRAAARPPRRVGRLWFAVAAVLVVVAVAGLVLIFRPELPAPAPPAPQETTPPAFRVPQSSAT